MSYTDVPPRRSALARRASRANGSARVRFDDEPVSPRDTTHTPSRSQSYNEHELASPTSDGAPHWHNPFRQDQDTESSYGDAQGSNYDAYYDDGQPTQHDIYDDTYSTQHDQYYDEPPGDDYAEAGERRPSDESEQTLYEDGEEDPHDYHYAEEGRYYDDPDEHDHARCTFSSYRHPYEIPAPSSAYTGPEPDPRPMLSVLTRPKSQSESEPNDKKAKRHKRPQDRDSTQNDMEAGGGGDREDRHRGLLSNLIDLYGLNRRQSGDEDSAEIAQPTNKSAERPWHLRRADSTASNASQVLDPDDPTITGATLNQIDDDEEVEKVTLRQMTYKQRRKERMRIRIEFNITSVVNRQMFLMRLAKALLVFGAPSHRIESQLLSAARILEVDAEFIHIPGVIICSFGDQDTKTSDTHFIKCGGRLSLGALHEVHQIYRAVVHDEMSAKKATVLLDEQLNAPPLYGTITRLALAFLISALICPLAFGGSFLDMWICGTGAVVLSLMQIGMASKSTLYANVFEISATIFVSFMSRGLSSIRSEIFCYTAISSASIVGILPGYLILSSSLELASKNIVCGSVKMVYALIYTLFLGFGLQIGSDLYLLLDQSARHDLSTLATRLQSTVNAAGTFVSDNGTTSDFTSFPYNGLIGTFSFTNSTPMIVEHIVDGCYRPPWFAWYLQPFPWWTQFIIVPLFSILSSLANLQPWATFDLVVMVVISCAAYTANKVANHYIFNHSDIVSAIGAFAVGALGNIYSRKMGGTAFTSMVTGVLFLVPSGLSQAGGITAQGSGIDIGAAMISVTVGITVGLFTSQAIVYMFGSRKNAAMFSF